MIAFAAWRARALTRGGAVAAFAVGTLTYGSGGWAFTLVLLAFFLPSVGLSRVGRARKKKLVDIGKGGARDAWQVFANGGVATLCALAALLSTVGFKTWHAAGGTGAYLMHAPLHTMLSTPGTTTAAWIAAFAGSYAAATADTWGTEIGTLAQGRPHSILTFRQIPTGLSGGVTLAGSAAEIAGAAWIALAAAAALSASIGWPAPEWTRATLGAIIVPVCVAGIIGAFVDSVLGATLQESRYCPACERTCETNPHVCGTATTLQRGIGGFSNDLVNFAATLAGAAVAFSLRSIGCSP